MKQLWKLPLYALAGLAGVWLTARFILPVGLPFLLALALAWAVEKPVRFLTGRGRFPRAAASALCVTLAIALVCGFFWLLGRTLYLQSERLVQRLPALLSSLSEPMARLRETLLRLCRRLPDGLSAAAASWVGRLFSGSSMLVSAASEKLLAFAGGLLTMLPELLLFFLTFLLSAYLISAQLPSLRDWAARRLPASWTQRSREVRQKLRGTLGGYLRAQLFLMLITFGIVTAGLLLLRIPNALLLGLIVAVVDALPVFGVGTVLLPWGVIVLLQGNTALAVGLFLLYAAASIMRTMLEPRIVGRQIGLPPLLTLVSLYAGYRLFGIPGMLLLPLAALLCGQIYELLESDSTDKFTKP